MVNVGQNFTAFERTCCNVLYALLAKLKEKLFHKMTFSLFFFFSFFPFGGGGAIAGKHPDSGLYSKGHSYPGYPSYIMMPNMNNDPYMSNGSLSPPIPRTVSALCLVAFGFFSDSVQVTFLCYIYELSNSAWQHKAQNDFFLCELCRYCLC